MHKSVVAVVLLSLAVPAFAQDTSSTVVVKPKKAKMVCRRLELTGTRLPGPSTCHTQEEWDQIDAANKSQAESISKYKQDMQRSTQTARPL